MNQVLINGIARTIPLPAESLFQGLIDYLQTKVLDREALISSVRIDGIEVVNPVETMGDVPISAMKSVEIITQGSNAFAIDTLKTLAEYIDHLQGRCRALRDLSGTPGFFQELGRIGEGISMLTQTVEQLKKLLNIPQQPELALLEADLLSVLQELLKYQEEGKTEYMIQLIDEHLTDVLSQWHGEGIALLSRSLKLT
jgi:hypothetical protein